MTMTLPATTPAAVPSAALDQVLRIVVVLFGAIEGITSLGDLATLFGDAVNIAATVLHPLLGFAAVAFALTKKLRPGIAALAVLALTHWAYDVLSLTPADLHWSGSAFLDAEAIFRLMIQPLIGCGAIAAAWFNRHLTAATLVVTLPTPANAAGIAAFAIGVMLYGF